MSNSAAAFANFPSEARGILVSDTYDPISLHTADVHVLFSGHAAQVTLSLEYVNETNRLVRAIAAYPVPPGFQLQYTTLTGPNRAVTDKVYQQSRALRSTEASSGLPTKSLYDIMVSAVATQTVPWDISPGDSVLMTSVYHAPLALIQRQSEIAFAMPTSLFPAVVRPPAAQRNYVKTAEDAASNRRVGKAGGLYLTVEGQLYRPLRGSVTLDKGGYVIVPQGDVQLNVAYQGDSGFRLTYQDTLPTKAYTQQALTVRAPVGDVLEPLRLHTVTVAPTETSPGVAAVALSMAPSFANCPVNTEIVFVVDVHTPEMAREVAEAVAAVIAPTPSTLPASVYANVLICSDTRRHGCVALFPTGSVPLANIPRASVLAYMKEEIAPMATKTKKGSLAPSVIYSPQLPAVLHDVLAGRNVATAVPDGYVRNVILITDAGALAKTTESAAMICDAATFATNTRVHCVALGAAADRATLETLALRAGGRYRNPAPAAAPLSKNLTSPLVAALQEVVVAAAVPCLANVRTAWRLVSKSRAGKTTPAGPIGVIHLAAKESGTDLPCIPRNTKRVLFGLITPPPPQPPSAETDNDAAEDASTAPLQLNVRVAGRVGNLSIEFTASALITRLADVGAVTATSPSAGSAMAVRESSTLPAVEEAASATPQPQQEQQQQQQPSPHEPQRLPSAAEVASQDNAVSVSPERDTASAASGHRLSVSATAPSAAGTPVKRNGKTLLLHTAAAAARIAFLSSDDHALTPAEAQEVIELSRRCMLPSPYTTLTDGKAPLSADQKRGGVVYMPSVLAKAQVAVAIRTRLAEAAAAAPSSSDGSGSKEKDEKGKEKEKKAGKKGGKDTVSLYSAR